MHAPLHPYLLSVICYLLSIICSASAAEAERLALAASLLETGDNARAALEYRRLAADLEPDDPSLPGLYLAAADAYRRDGAWERMTKVLDHAEDAGAGGTPQLLLLRAEQAEGAQDWVPAGDYAAELAQTSAGNARLAAWARGTAASNYLRSHGIDDARGAVAHQRPGDARALRDVGPGRREGEDDRLAGAVVQRGPLRRAAERDGGARRRGGGEKKQEWKEGNAVHGGRRVGGTRPRSSP